MLKGKHIVVGVCGGIAAYKAVDVVSRLRKAGAEINVIMTKEATEFVTPLTFKEISGSKVTVDMWQEPHQWNVQHIALATWADLFLIVPATANIIGKIANGIADDMLSTTVMATTAKVIFAPAMNTNMYLNPIVQKNITALHAGGYTFIAPADGSLACGTSGPGRLPEPVAIVEQLEDVCADNTAFAGKKFIVTAGGTREPIDPVRYIGNRSSGKMGYAIAKAAAKAGAEVVLVSGPTALERPQNMKIIDVNTTEEMRKAVLNEFATADVVIKAAAVADFRPQTVASQKIKKSDDLLTIVLEKNPDILLELGKKKQHQILVGFAAETQELINHAAEKLTKKNLDMIVANDITIPGAGFNADTNIVKILHRDGQIEELNKMSKAALAGEILSRVTKLLAVR